MACLGGFDVKENIVWTAGGLGSGDGRVILSESSTGKKDKGEKGFH